MTAVVSAVKPWPLIVTTVPPAKDPCVGVKDATLKRVSTEVLTNALPVLFTQT
jgi:hypothetical protein